jgi:nucleoid-associated protein YgaU
VGEGETLATIAEQYYEDGAQWRRIYDANKEAIGDNPDSIKIGQTLKIPPKE